MTSTLRHLTAGLIAAGAICSASPSQAAGTYGQTDFNGGPFVTTHAPGLAAGGEGTYSNDFTTYISTDPSGNPLTQTIDTYCIDLFHNNNQGGNPYAAVSLITANAYTDGRDIRVASPTDYQLQGLGRAAWLVDHFANSAGVDTVALQLAVWKADYESQGAKNAAAYTDLTSGTIFFTDLNNFTNQQLADAVTYLKTSLSYGGGQFAVGSGIWVSYGSTGFQDQIAVDPNFKPNSNLVPEPATLAMCATAFLTVSGLVWRRGRKARGHQA